METRSQSHPDFTIATYKLTNEIEKWCETDIDFTQLWNIIKSDIKTHLIFAALTLKVDVSQKGSRRSSKIKMKS